MVHFTPALQRAACLLPQRASSSSFSSASSQVSPADAPLLLTTFPFRRCSSRSWARSGALSQLRRLCSLISYFFLHPVVSESQRAEERGEERTTGTSSPSEFPGKEGREEVVLGLRGSCFLITTSATDYHR